MLSRELEVSLNLAFKDARAKRHEMMTVEHLLLSLLDNTAAVTVLKACNANLDKLRAELETSYPTQRHSSLRIKTTEKRSPRLGSESASTSRLPRAVIWEERSHRCPSVGGAIR